MRATFLVMWSVGLWDSGSECSGDRWDTFQVTRGMCTIRLTWMGIFVSNSGKRKPRGQPDRSSCWFSMNPGCIRGSPWTGALPTTGPTGLSPGCLCVLLDRWSPCPPLLAWVLKPRNQEWILCSLVTSAWAQCRLARQHQLEKQTRGFEQPWWHTCPARGGSG